MKKNTDMIKKARELRHNMTLTEMILWKRLRSSPMNGLKFRRQHPLGPFIVDFYCPAKKLVIEIDGEVRPGEVAVEQDFRRQPALEKEGHQVLRFTHEVILKDIDGVMKTIMRKCS